MSQTADDAAVTLDPIEVSGERVTLEREPEFRDEGVVLTYRLRSGSDDSYVVTVADEVPEPLPTESAGFNPENEPASWELDGRGLSFEAVVPREGERMVVFGVALAETAESDVELAEPTVEAVEEADDRNDLDAAIPDVETPDRADAIAEVIEDESAGADGAADAAGDGPASSDEIEAALETLSDEDGDGATAGAASTAETALDGDLEPAAVRVAEGESATDADETETEATTDDEPRLPEEGLVDALVAELEAGDVTDEQREALADAFGYASEDSLDVRLRHVQSRMDDFAAYADALEEIIDEHGTADAFMAEIDERVTAVEETIDERVAGVEDRFDDLEARLDAVEETAADDREIEALREELAALEDDIEEVAGMRESLLQALAEE